MSGMAKAMIIGYVGADPDLRHTTAGRAVARLRVASTRRFKKNDGTQTEQTTWLTCIGWGQTAETLSKYVTKGRQIYIEGRLQERDYTDKEGIARKAFEVVIENFQLLGSRPGGSTGGSQPAAETSEFDDAGDTYSSGEDLPF